MKLCAMEMDENNRSFTTEVEVPMQQVSETEWISEKQDASYWGIAISQPGEPFPGGPTEMHLTNSARIVWSMQGHAEITQQNGETCRLATGEGIYVDGRALHHSVFAPSRVPVITLNITFDETVDYEFK